MPEQAGRLLLDALDSLLDRYRKRVKICRREISEDAVHELRIATRRLLSLIELFRELAPQARLAKPRQIIKDQLDSFDDLRDTQVMLLEISKAVENLPELNPFLLHLRQRERLLQQQSQIFIDKLRIGKLKRKLKKSRRRCKHRIVKSANFRDTLLAVIDNIYATALIRHQALNPAILPSIHHLRIAVKKLRYILAAVQPLLPGIPAEQQSHMQDYLALMGDIQNSAVLLIALEGYFVDGVPSAVQAHFLSQQQGLVTTFMSRKDEVLQFWRA